MINKAELAHAIMKVVFSRVGGSCNFDAARAYIAKLSPDEAEQIKAEALEGMGG